MTNKTNNAVQNALEFGRKSLEDPRLETPKARGFGKRVRRLNAGSRGHSALRETSGVHEIGGQNLYWIGTGCPWSETPEGQCTMCDGYGQHPDLARKNPERIGNIQRTIEKVLKKIKVDSEERLSRDEDRFTVNVGSAATFDNYTFPEEARVELYKGINEIAKPWLNQGKKVTWVTETRPEDITEETLSKMREYVDPRIWTSIGIGLESENKFVRESLVNKGTSKGVMGRLREIAKKGIKYNSGIEGHAILGIPGLNESESMASAIQTARAITDMGADNTILMTGNVKEGGEFSH